MPEPIQLASYIPTIIKTVREHRMLLMIPTIGLTICAFLYAVSRPTSWKASQALVVRDEAIGSLDRPAGQFANPDAMKTAQETILELARNPKMIASALIEAGPKKKGSTPDDWPTPGDVGKLQDSITVEAPRGAEFGMTEVIYLSLEGPTQDRAKELASAVCNQLDLKLREMRDRKAKSITDELFEKVIMAESELNDATTRLEEVEKEVGSLLGDLRILNSSGNSPLQSTLNEIETELRQARTKQIEQLKQKELLAKALQDPNQLVATPNQLLEDHPSLRRLKDGLVDAQLRTAEMRGRMTIKHPLVRAAIANEQQVRDHLHKELAVSFRGLEDDLRLGQVRIDSLDKQKVNVSKQLNTLASMRAVYSNLLGEVKNRANTLEESEKVLADAQATRTAALASSLISQLDEPQVGNSPVGPGKSLIVLVGMIAGLMSGVGLITLAAPIGSLRNRRWSDMPGFGRRAGDQKAGRQQANSGQRTGRRASDSGKHNRRASDQPSGQTPPTDRRRASD